MQHNLRCATFMFIFLVYYTGSFTVVGEVQNLTAILQPNYEFGPETFLTLQWDAPIKNSDDEINSYDIRFKPKDGDSYREESVDGSSRTITLTKASGIEPLTTYKFKVRARIGDTEGKWKAVSQYIGRCKMLLYVKKQGQSYPNNSDVIYMLIYSLPHSCFYSNRWAFYIDRKL